MKIVKQYIKDNVTVTNYRDGYKWAQHFCVHTEGCHYMGEIIVRDLRAENNGKEVKFDSRMAATDLSAYVAGLWEKHLG